MNEQKIQGKIINNENVIIGKAVNSEQIKGKICTNIDYIINSSGETSDATAIESDVLYGKTAYGINGKFTGTMPNNGAINKILDIDNIFYTILKGYHDGNGKVEISLEQKITTPTKSSQTISPTSGKVLSKVVVDPIPDNYIDTSDATATASNIQSGKTAYVNGKKITGTHVENTELDTSDATAIASDILYNKTAYVNGEKITGSMTNNGSVEKTLDTSTTSYTIPKGYHSGLGKVDIVTEIKTVTPSTSEQIITPTSGKVLSSVSVNAIPNNYIDTSDATATENDIILGQTAYVNGQKIIGTIQQYDIVSMNFSSIEIDDSYNINIKGIIDEAIALHKNGGSLISVPASNFGNAIASDVKKGKTFTSSDGLVVTGTHECDITALILQSKSITPSETEQIIYPDSGYDGLSDVIVSAIPNNYIDTSDADATASNIQLGKTAYVNGEKITGTHDCSSIDTSDATATAENIEKDYTAYVNGEKITGTIQSKNAANLLANSSLYSNDGVPSYSKSTGTSSTQMPNRISIKYTNNTKQIIPKDGTVTATAKAELFGDATTDDVIKGKTFTSINGLKLTGTHECSGSSSTLNLQSKSVTPSESEQIITPDSGYNGLSEVIIDAISETYIGSEIIQKEEDIYIPTTSDQIIASGQYLSGIQTIKGDSNLIADNIKKGISIFNIDGNYEASLQSKTVTPTKSSQTISSDTNYDGLSSVFVNPIPDNYIDTSDADATASNIQLGKTAYVNGVKITGTHTEQTSLDTSDATASASDITNGKTAYVNGEKITGTIQNGDEVYY